MRFGKISTLFWALLLIIVTKISQTQPVIFNWAFSLNGLTSGALLAGLILALYARWLSTMSVVLGMGGSVGIMISLQITMELTDTKWLAWPWFTITGALCGLLLSFFLNAVGVGKKITASQKH